MIFESPLLKGKLIKRYKRFFADVELDSGEQITAHCPNTGSMKTCGTPGDVIYVSHNPSPKRKLKYTWEFTETPAGLIGINTNWPNKVVSEGIENGLVKELTGYRSMRREVKYGSQNSRIDILLEDHPNLGAQKCWVEIKNTTLYQDPYVSFPDAVTARGLKHLEELTEQVLQGDRGVIFFFVNRGEGKAFYPAYEIDPAYCKGLKEAIDKGVEVLVYRSKPSLKEVSIGEAVDWQL